MDGDINIQFFDLIKKLIQTILRTYYIIIDKYYLKQSLNHNFLRSKYSSNATNCKEIIDGSLNKGTFWRNFRLRLNIEILLLFFIDKPLIIILKNIFNGE